MAKHITRGLAKGRYDPLSKDQEMTCGAMCKSRRYRYDLRLRQRLCKNPPVEGRTRCRFHGGMSTGAKTPEGKTRSIAAMVAGRQAWVERMKEAGEKFPCGKNRKLTPYH